MSETQQPPTFQLEIPGEVATKTFASQAEVVAWLEAERAYWRAFFKRANQDDPALATLAGEFNSVLVTLINDARSANPQDILKLYAKRIRGSDIIYSESVRGRMVSKLAESDPAQAARLALSFRNRAADIRNTNWGLQWARAAATAELIDHGLLNDESVNAAVLGDFISNWDKKFVAHDEVQSANLKSQADELAKMQETSAQFQELKNSSAIEWDKLREKLEAETKAAIDRGHSEIAAVKETYKTELTLQAPTTYWSSKQIAHRIVAAGWAIAFTAAAWGAIEFIAQIWILTAEPRFVDNANPTYGVFLPTLGAFFLSVWVLRIISRQLLNQFVLSSDAGERVAMVKTFLALMQKPDHVKDADRALILAALFRPAGKTEDDATPRNLVDAVLQRVKG